jgi:hypothetical protein
VPTITEPGPDPSETPWVRARTGTRRALNTALGRAGLELVPKAPVEQLEPEFAELHERCAPFTMTSRERMYALWQAINHVTAAKVPGDIVECGVWRGGSTLLAAMTLARRGDAERRLWLFDTFEGMAEPGPMDAVGASGEDPRAVWSASQTDDHNTWCYASLDDVTANMTLSGLASERFTFVKGKVEDTIPASIPGPIAVLRLDTDWYESTRHELHHLFPLLQPGGVLIIDDYGHWEGARRAVDEYLEQTGTHLLLARVDATGRIAVKA